MIEDNLKTLFDTEWDAARAIVLSLTQTTYVLKRTDQNATELEPPELTAGNVAIVLKPARGTPRRMGQNSDLWTYEGELVLHGLTVNNMDTAVIELKAIAVANTVGTLIFFVPAIRGEVDEGQYVALCGYEWRKIEARS